MDFLSQSFHRLSAEFDSNCVSKQEKDEIYALKERVLNAPTETLIPPTRSDLIEIKNAIDDACTLEKKVRDAQRKPIQNPGFFVFGIGAALPALRMAKFPLLGLVAVCASLHNPKLTEIRQNTFVKVEKLRKTFRHEQKKYAVTCIQNAAKSFTKDELGTIFTTVPYYHKQRHETFEESTLYAMKRYFYKMDEKRLAESGLSKNDFDID